jgi:hypothetical protein
VKGGLEPKLEHYGTSKKIKRIKKTRGLQITIQVATLKITSCRTMLEKKKENI